MIVGDPPHFNLLTKFMIPTSTYMEIQVPALSVLLAVNRALYTFLMVRKGKAGHETVRLVSIGFPYERRSFSSTLSRKHIQKLCCTGKGERKLDRRIWSCFVPVYNPFAILQCIHRCIQQFPCSASSQVLYFFFVRFR